MMNKSGSTNDTFEKRSELKAFCGMSERDYQRLLYLSNYLSTKHNPDNIEVLHVISPLKTSLGYLIDNVYFGLFLEREGFNYVLKRAGSVNDKGEYFSEIEGLSKGPIGRRSGNILLLDGFSDGMILQEIN